MKTYSEARARLRWYQGRYIDFDGWYGYQCADLAVDYIYWLLEIRMWGNAKDAINESSTLNWTNSMRIDIVNLRK